MFMMRSKSLALCLLVLGSVGLAGCGAEEASNSGDGTMKTVRSAVTVATTSSEYKLPAAVDPDVLDDRATELWARVYRPATLVAGRRYPVLVFLHGNHATCGRGSNPRIDDNIQYTTTGTCPEGYVVVPSHEGYAYVADQLASEEYIVVSINANRGINAGSGVVGDFGLNLARGRLVLKHLTVLSQWDRGVAPTPATLGVSLRDRLDFSQVGLMGHSRGGEGMRAAYNQYLDPGSPWPGRIVTPVSFRGIFEIGPVDGQTSRVLDMQNTKWSVLLPMCDGDVSDLQGIRPLDRSMGFLQETPPSFKSSLTAWGTNHNYYNSEWQTPDSFGCTDHTPIFTFGAGITGSPEQREVGRITMSSFFLGNIGAQADPLQNALFDPLNVLLEDLLGITRVDRGFTLSPDADVTLRLEDFVNPTGTSTFGQPNVASNITITHTTIPEHDFSLRGGAISWTSSGASRFFQTNFTPSGSGISLASYGTLDLRVDRAFDPLNPATPTDFTVQLVGANNALSAPQRIASYLSLVGPVGGQFSRHSMLQTARIPLARFSPTTLGSIRGVRLTFNQTASGAIYVANIRATRAECAATPKLDLKIRQVLRQANQIQFRIQVYNRDSVPVRLSDLSTKLWIADPTANLVTDVYYGGHVFDGAGRYQFGGVTATGSTTRIQPACVSEPGRIADWAANVTNTDSRFLPPNGGVWVDAVFSVHRADWSPLSSFADDFSQTPAYQGGSISDQTWPNVYGDDIRFVVYHRGTPAREVVTATAPDPAGGREPSCVLSCVDAVTGGPSSSAASSGALSSSAAGGLGATALPATAALSQGAIVRLSPTTHADIPGGIDLEVVGDTAFPVGGQAPVLGVGTVEVALSRYPDPADLRRMIFTLTAEQLASAPQGGPVTVRYGRSTSSPRWELGTLDKSRLQP